MPACWLTSIHRKTTNERFKQQRSEPMDLGLKGKVALLTAASRGLGLAVARELAQEGARLAICSRSHDAIENAADSIRRQTGAEVLAITADVTDAAQITRIVAETTGKYGELDIL